jgi:hypothetical protein
MSNTKKRFKQWPPSGATSEEFILCFMDGGSSVAARCFCGRQHYSGGDAHLFDDPEEYLGMEAQHEKDPEACIEQEGPVIYGTLCGNQVVFNCPCNFASWYEEELRENGVKINQFLREFLGIGAVRLIEL